METRYLYNEELASQVIKLNNRPSSLTKGSVSRRSHSLSCRPFVASPIWNGEAQESTSEEVRLIRSSILRLPGQCGLPSRPYQPRRLDRCINWVLFSTCDAAVHQFQPSKTSPKAIMIQYVYGSDDSSWDGWITMPTSEHDSFPFESLSSQSQEYSSPDNWPQSQANDDIANHVSGPVPSQEIEWDDFDPLLNGFSNRGHGRLPRAIPDPFQVTEVNPLHPSLRSFSFLPESAQSSQTLDYGYDPLDSDDYASYESQTQGLLSQGSQSQGSQSHGYTADLLDLLSQDSSFLQNAQVPIESSMSSTQDSGYFSGVIQSSHSSADSSQSNRSDLFEDVSLSSQSSLSSSHNNGSDLVGDISQNSQSSVYSSEGSGSDSFEHVSQTSQSSSSSAQGCDSDGFEHIPPMSQRPDIIERPETIEYTTVCEDENYDYNALFEFSSQESSEEGRPCKRRKLDI